MEGDATLSAGHSKGWLLKMGNMQADDVLPLACGGLDVAKAQILKIQIKVEGQRSKVKGEGA